MPDSSTRLLKRARWAAGAVVVLLLLGGATVLILRSVKAQALEAATEIHARQYVVTVQPKAGGGATPLTLPGTLQGFIESTVYARSSGYVASWTHDIGATVKKGELLAVITAPEIDQQLYQAEAARAQAASSEALAKSTADRWKSLRERDAVTQQDFDERTSTYTQAQANLKAAEANVARLHSLQGFNRIVAPFDGVLTRRNIDVGDLVDAGNGGATKALFSVAQIDPLRLYVYVPQAFAHEVHEADVVSVTMAERPGESFAGSIANTARAIDVATRTMQVEIRVPNPQGKLIAGSYVQVEFPIKSDSAAVIVPTNTLLFRPDGPRAAVVDPQGRVRLSPLKLGTDFGTSIAVLSGLAQSDHVIANPADSLADGDVVVVRPPAPVAAAPGGAGGGKAP